VRGKSGQKSILNRFDIDPCNMTNTIRYRYDIDASGIEAEPDFSYHELISRLESWKLLLVYLISLDKAGRI
jgi:hypothetical protein